MCMGYEFTDSFYTWTKRLKWTHLYLNGDSCIIDLFVFLTGPAGPKIDLCLQWIIHQRRDRSATQNNPRFNSVSHSTWSSFPLCWFRNIILYEIQREDQKLWSCHYLLFFHLHPLFASFSGALLNGWRWGRYARCATCPSCSSPSSKACPNPCPRRSSLCPEWRTWCSPSRFSCDHLHTPFCTGTSSHPRTDCRICPRSHGDLWLSCVRVPPWWLYKGLSQNTAVVLYLACGMMKKNRDCVAKPCL